jgi:membrane associated rhomboid family serine protease
MIPVSDDNPTVETPWMTYLIVAATALVWLVFQGAGLDARLVKTVCEQGLVPAELTGMRPIGFAVPLGGGMACVVDDSPLNWLTPVTTMFLHGGWGHVIGNLWFFWVFGNNIDDSMGPRRFLVFYLLCGLIASVAHIATQPASAVPTVGASGAVSGIMGAYLVLYPRARVNLLFFFVVFVRIIPVPAWAALLWWFAWQVLSALPALQQADELSGGVAFAAHVGGFVAGLVLIRFFADPRRLEQQRLLHNARYPARPAC